ncbi:MAG: transposase, partial [Acidobacteriaceae bacterium]
TPFTPPRTRALAPVRGLFLLRRVHLGVYALPESHRKRMRTTNMLERQNQELKRRTRVVRVFPNGQSCLRLVSALLIETSQQWMERIYLRMEEEPAELTDALTA